VSTLNSSLDAGHRYAAETRCAIDAAQRAAAEILARYGSTDSTVKAGGSPVTEADHAASRAILATIAESFPSDKVLCEETSDDGSRLDADRLWIVDPLDGTKEFLARNGEFSVMIALVEERPVVGVVYLPAQDVLYAGVDGLGAWVRRAGSWSRLRRRPPAAGLRLVTSRSHSDRAVDALSAALPVTERRPSGSVGIKCALIAEDRCDLYVHPVPYMGEWDTCAPEVVLREAGGSVTDCAGEPLRYNKPDPHQPLGILACAPGVLEQVLPVVSGLLGQVRV
jgi:3'(2'), 5'-bisphosphate nucleotidase